MLSYGYFGSTEVLQKYVPTLLDLLDSSNDKWEGNVTQLLHLQ